MEWDGLPRRVLVHPECNGLVYVLDRETGEVLSAAPFHHITAHRGVDMKTGRLIHVEEKKPSLRRMVRDICPTAPGAKDWRPSAFSHRTGLLYIRTTICAWTGDSSRRTTSPAPPMSAPRC